MSGIILIPRQPTPEFITEQRERIIKARVQVRSHPDLIGIGPLIDKFKDVLYLPGHKTCATDGSYFYFNPFWVSELPQPLLRTVVVHEALHIGFSHHLRLAQGDYDLRVANVAMDHVINNQISQMAAFRSGFLGKPREVWQWECDTKYADASKWDFDRVYADIYVAPPEQPDEQPQVPTDCESDDGEGEPDDEQQGGGGGGGDDDGDEQGESAGDEQSDDGDESEADGGGSGSGSNPDTGDGDDSDTDQQQGGSGSGQQPQGHGQDTQDSQGQGGQGQGEQPTLPDGRPMPTEFSGDAFGEVLPHQAESKQEADEEHQEIQEALAQGDFMEKMIGQGAGTDNVMSRIREFSNEDIGDWELLRDMLVEAYSPENTWARPNIYHMTGHGYLPSSKKTAGDLVCWVDVSGSMTVNELKACYNNLIAICQDIDVREVKIGYFDDGPRRPDTADDDSEYFTTFDVSAGDEPEFVVLGRGGTHVDPCFEVTEQELDDVQAMIVFTDGEVYVSVDAPEYPVIWATTNREPTFWQYNTEDRARHGRDGIEHGWGEVVHIKARRWFEAA